MYTEKKTTYFLPFLLTLSVIAIDQLSKFLIVTSIEPWSIGFQFFGDIIRIVCVYNTGAAFSLGHGLSTGLRFVMLACIPTIFIAGMGLVYFKTNFTYAQRWCLCGIIGGGISNLLDRFFRSEGVVDFIDVKFFGLFGLERWPTFNIADSAIVISAFILFITILLQDWKENRKKQQIDKEICEK